MSANELAVSESSLTKSKESHARRRERAYDQRVVAVQAESVDEVLGANTIAEMMHLDAAMRLATARRLMASGVTIFRPETCVIDAAVNIAPDTVIEPYVQILGPTRIGSECRIRSYSVIQHSTIGDNVTIGHAAVLHGCTVEDQCLIGIGAILLNGVHVGAGSIVAAGTLLVEGQKIPPRSLVMGSPGKTKRLLTQAELADIQLYADRYVGYRLDYM